MASQSKSPLKSNVLRPLHITLDFDSTITKYDTLNELVDSVMHLHPEKTRSSVQAKWGHCTKGYFDDYIAFSEAYPVKKANRSSLQMELEFLKALKNVEERSFKRVDESPVFHWPIRESSRAEDLRREGRKAVETENVLIRNGFRSFIHELGTRSGGWENGLPSWDVVSVNFSDQWIGGCLEGALQDTLDVPRVPIMANNIDENGNVRFSCSSHTINQIGPRLLSCHDKAVAYRFLRSMHNAHHPIHVYIGDSLTDLECLMDADIGICMYTKDQSALKEVFARCGQPVSHISDYQVARDVNLYYANDFEEILQSRLLDSPDVDHT